MMKIGVFFADAPYYAGKTESLKKHLLLFDKIYLLDMPVMDVEKGEQAVVEQVKLRQEELSLLRNTGLVSSFSHVFSNGIPDDIQALPIVKESVRQLSDFFKSKEATNKHLDVHSTEAQDFIHEGLQRSTRVLATALNVKEPQHEHIPIINIQFLSDLFPSEQKTLVVNTLFTKMPALTSDTPIEAIMELKADPDACYNLAALRDFINTLSREKLSISEIEDKLGYLLAQYEKSLHLHHLKYNYSSLEIVVKTTAEILENLATFKFSKAFEGYLAFRNREVDLLIDEQNLNGRELAYISQINQLF